MGTVHTIQPSRVPPPGDAAVRPPWAQAQHQRDDLSNGEVVAIAHLRGIPHFGPTCPICVGGAS